LNVAAHAGDVLDPGVQPLNALPMSPFPPLWADAPFLKLVNYVLQRQRVNAFVIEPISKGVSPFTSASVPLSGFPQLITRVPCSSTIPTTQAWLPYGCLIRIVLAGNTREGNSTKPYELKFENRIKRLILWVVLCVFP
jgi:hypothetical protein